MTPRALAEVLDFLNSIEGAGYGGMASFEIARQHVAQASGVAMITPEMIEAGARAIAPEVWAADVSIFGHPDGLNRHGHEYCKSIVRAQAAGCIEAALKAAPPSPIGSDQP